ncbi:hypothetical protein [Sphingomonas pituitosa]|uniref:hypothetical protein n=1 Tax=Sphingomonas pituitosa TaxID=99597 RepID=UPI00082F5FFD|nr:hypothetical protein [Sphingomonas pituitosa]
MGNGKAVFRYGMRLLAALVSLAPGAALAQFVPPAGYPGTPGPAVAEPAEPGLPRLEALDRSAIGQRIRMLPGYANAAHALAKVVGAYTVAETRRARFVDAWGLGYLPLNLKRSDGTCFALGADYVGGTLSNARLRPIGCDARRIVEKPGAAPPEGSALRHVGTRWSYSAWFDDKAAETLVTRPWPKTFEPFFAIRMEVFAIAAMNGPDWPGGNVTLAGRIDGRLTIVVLDVRY